MKRETAFQCPLYGPNSGIVEKACATKTTVTAKKSGSKGAKQAAISHENPTKPSKTAMERIDALRKAGEDVSNLFAMQGSNGGEHIVSNKDGHLTILQDDDPIFSSIARQGTVYNRRLFRRWVMAQMFHMMSYIPYGQKEPLGVTEMIHRLGYEYQWKMLMNELHAQMKMEGRDAANFADRNRWFNARVVAAMAQDYIERLKERVDALEVKKCKDIPYKRIGSRDIFVADLQSKLYNPLQMAIWHIERAKNAAQLYNAAKTFNSLRIKMAYDTPQSKAWVDAYKGSGAFFTMQNLIRFHDCMLRDDDGIHLDKAQSLAFLSLKAEMYKVGKGYCLFAVLKRCWPITTSTSGKRCWSGVRGSNP